MCYCKFRNWTISASYTGSKPAPFDEQNLGHNYVTVTNRINGKRTRFDFRGSRLSPAITDDDDLCEAFWSFVQDAICGDLPFDDFCAEFGYDTDSRKAERTWRACKRAAEKLRRVYCGDLCELANELESATSAYRNDWE